MAGSGLLSKGKKIDILKTFESCMKSANSRQKLKARRQTKKPEREPLRAAKEKRTAAVKAKIKE